MTDFYKNGDRLLYGTDTNVIAGAALTYTAEGIEELLSGGGLSAFRGLKEPVRKQIEGTFDEISFSTVTLLHGLAEAVSAKKLYAEPRPNSHYEGSKEVTISLGAGLPNHTAVIEIRASSQHNRPVRLITFRDRTKGVQGTEVAIPDPTDLGKYIAVVRQRLAHNAGAMALGEERVFISTVWKQETLLAEPLLPREQRFQAALRTPVVAALIMWPLSQEGGPEEGSRREVALPSGLRSLSPASKQATWTDEDFLKAEQRIMPVIELFKEAKADLTNMLKQSGNTQTP